MFGAERRRIVSAAVVAVAGVTKKAVESPLQHVGEGVTFEGGQLRRELIGHLSMQSELSHIFGISINFFLSTVNKFA